jgi:hypothetical protein
MSTVQFSERLFFFFHQSSKTICDNNIMVMRTLGCKHKTLLHRAEHLPPPKHTYKMAPCAGKISKLSVKAASPPCQRRHRQALRARQNAAASSETSHKAAQNVAAALLPLPRTARFANAALW